MATRPLYRIRDGFYDARGDIELPVVAGIPQGYTDISPVHLTPAPDEWIRATFDRGNFWILTSVLPAWDVAAYSRRLEQAKLMAIAELEFLFDRILALGMRYDFGAAGVVAKAADPRSQGGTVAFIHNLEHPHSNVDINCDPADGYLHVQARVRDRSTLQGVEMFSQKLVDKGMPTDIGWQMTENISVPLSRTGLDEMSFALGLWYSGKFNELRTHKETIRAMTEIQSVVDYTPIFSAN